MKNIKEFCKANEEKIMEAMRLAYEGAIKNPGWCYSVHIDPETGEIEQREIYGSAPARFMNDNTFVFCKYYMTDDAIADSMHYDSAATEESLLSRVSDDVKEAYQAYKDEAETDCNLDWFKDNAEDAFEAEEESHIDWIVENYDSFYEDFERGLQEATWQATTATR